MWIACSVASAGTVYKWVDENGVTHYSDQPHENAAKVDLRQPQTYSAPKIAPQPNTAVGPVNPRDAKPYDSCTITQPNAEQVFFNTFEVTVSLQTQPALRSIDHVAVLLDGKAVAGLADTGSQFTLSALDRGTHSVQATLQDMNGVTVCRTPGITFYIRQPSQQAPNGANRPKT